MAMDPADDYDSDLEDATTSAEPHPPVEHIDDGYRIGRPYTKEDETRAHCVINENPYWLVEEIRDAQFNGAGKLLYLVKWGGYPEYENTWEPEENLGMARRLIAEFHQKSSAKTSDLVRQIFQSRKESLTVDQIDAKSSGPKKARRAAVLNKPKKVPRQRSKLETKTSSKKKRVSSTLDSDSNHSASTVEFES